MTNDAIDEGAPRLQSWAGVDYTQNSSIVARALIGMTLTIDGVGGVIVETEAYDSDEPASHSFRGPTMRNATLFGPPGCAYVYLSYGLHWCLNFVCREAGHGAGVLIRALQPTSGIPKMIERRAQRDERLLCSGPGRLGQALAVTRNLDGRRIDVPPFELAPGRAPAIVACGTRIGISKAVEYPWRFGLAGSGFLSRPFPGVIGSFRVEASKIGTEQTPESIDAIVPPAIGMEQCHEIRDERTTPPDRQGSARPLRKPRGFPRRSRA